ncbi:hypothetical protein Tco_0821457 [Tanacetum coccineum]|uniref:Uncharacterized protein n=1 Tax=Tanacetum coccineum TaxID=301880 RepID=A0ABQ5AGN0_9ASTR
MFQEEMMLQNNPDDSRLNDNVNTATPEDLVGPIPASEDTQVEDQEIELGNIPQTYAVPTTPHTRIHKDHLIEHVIGDVQSSVQIKDEKLLYTEQGNFLLISEGKKAMHENFYRSILQNVLDSCDLPKGHQEHLVQSGYTNNKDERVNIIQKQSKTFATSTTEAEYVAAASCCGQVLWIQNQLLDYGYNFMNTVIYIDNNSTICIIENPVQHSKTKHIEIRHHFIRDCNAKKLIQMAKIDTEHNVADLLTKGFDAGRFQSAEATTNDNGEVQITATIDGHSKIITESSLRRHLKLDDHDGITIPNSEIFEQLALMGYHTDSDKLTFQKGAFSPQ